MPLLPVIVRGFLPATFKNEYAEQFLMQPSELGTAYSVSIRGKDNYRSVQMHVQLNESVRNKQLFRAHMEVGQMLMIKFDKHALLNLQVMHNPNFHNDVYWNNLTKDTATRVALTCL